MQKKIEIVSKLQAHTDSMTLKEERETKEDEWTEVKDGRNTTPIINSTIKNNMKLVQYIARKRGRRER